MVGIGQQSCDLKNSGSVRGHAFTKTGDCGGGGGTLPLCRRGGGGGDVWVVCGSVHFVCVSCVRCVCVTVRVYRVCVNMYHIDMCVRMCV